jgi:hypothetical protein
MSDMIMGIVKLQAAQLPCKDCGKSAEAVKILDQFSNKYSSVFDIRGWHCRHCGLNETLNIDDLQ